MKAGPVFPILVSLVVVLGLNGCAVGVNVVTPPPRLPSRFLLPLTRPVTFDVCVSTAIQPRTAFEPERMRRGHEIQSALLRAGVPAELKSSAESPVDLTITVGTVAESGEWSFILPLLALSIIPGHVVQRVTLDADFGWVDATQARRADHLQLQSREEAFIWLPLIVHPDFVAGINGGWESTEKHDAAFAQTIGRLGDEIRLRLGRHGETPPTGQGGAVPCPRPTKPAVDSVRRASSSGRPPGAAQAKAT